MSRTLFSYDYNRSDEGRQALASKLTVEDDMDWYRRLKSRQAASNQPTLREEKVPEEVPPGGKVTPKKKRSLLRRQPGGKISPSRIKPTLFRDRSGTA
jgi:hypothetical protein